jgi:N-dimethylarginine dimethylaminohydrolase
MDTIQQSSSSLFPNGRWLMCRPVDYDVRYQINPWMDVSRTPEKGLAVKQWSNLHHHIIRLGGWVEYVPHADGWPDMVFTANAGLVRGRNVVLAKFRHPERAGEEHYFREWFEEAGFSVVEVTGGTFEGEGDALFAGDKLFCGYGFRSEIAAYEEIGQALNVRKLIPVRLRDDRFYHLDTCFCPLTPNLALIYPGAFDAEDLKSIERSIELIGVSPEEAARFVCNAVVLGSDIILPAGCPKTYGMLAERGYRTHPVVLDEFLKAGGAAKCLSLKLDN